MNYLFFDTETNGKPKNFKAPIRDVDNWPRLAQIAWLLTDDDGIVLEMNSMLIQPDGWEIPNEKFFIDHNLTTERCEQEGVFINYALVKFLCAAAQSDLMIAHNMAFDYAVIGAEMIRHGITTNKKTPRFCSMEQTTDLLKIPGFYGEYKWPKLEELHQFCFGNDFENKHDALGDVTALAKCFHYLKNNNLITIPTLKT